MPILTRSASLTHFAEIARECGLDPLALLRQVGLPLKCLSDPDMKVDARAVGDLLEMAAQQAGEPAFGLRMAQSRQLSNLGPLGLLLRDEPTLRHALDAIVRYIRVHNEALVIQVEESDDLVLIREAFLADALGPRQQAAELAMAVTYRLLSLFMGVTWRPRLVCFSHPAPANRSTHQRVFGDKLQFGHEFNGMVCNRSDLAQPNPSADPVMARYAQELVEAQAVSAPTFAQQVRQLIVYLLPLGQCKAEVVAQQLGCDRRTVSRKLAQENTAFHALVDDHRRRMAGHYLQAQAQPLAQVSALLGFSAPSAFSRWYRDQFGTPPSSAAVGTRRP